MRIALFHNLPSGGAKRAVHEWMRRLPHNHVVDVYTISTANHDFCDIRPFAHAHEVMNFTPRKLFGSPFGRLNQLQRWRDLLYLTRIHKAMAAEINIGDYDVLFANPCMVTFIPILLQYIEIPSVYYLHEPFGAGFVRHFERPYHTNNSWRESLNRVDPFIWLYQHQLDFMQKRSFYKTKLILANSQYTGEVHKKMFGEPALFCPYGVDLKKFYPITDSARGNYVISVGEMTPRKGFDFVVESLGNIPADKRPRLIIASNMVDDDELNFIQGLAANTGVNLEFRFQLNTEQLRLLYNRAQLCVYAPVQEPFGLVPLEAMACGTPVVGVREGGVQESVVHEYNGLLVERDPQKFGAAIQYMLANPDLAAVYGQNGREYVIKNWTWDQSVSRLIAYLEECAGAEK